MKSVLSLTDEPGLVLIPDAGGSVHPYHLRPCPAHPGERAAYLLAREEGEEYRVSLGRFGWACGCKAWQYGRGRKCKHVVACAAVRAVTEMLREEAEIAT